MSHRKFNFIECVTCGTLMDNMGDNCACSLDYPDPEPEDMDPHGFTGTAGLECSSGEEREAEGEKTGGHHSQDFVTAEP